MPDKVFHYVPNGLVYAWENFGWVRHSALDGTHHGGYSSLMEWTGEGEPQYPEKKRA